MDRQKLALIESIEERARLEASRRISILKSGLVGGANQYRKTRWAIAVIVGILSGVTAYLSSHQPAIAAIITVLLSFGGFWFVPEVLNKPLNALAIKTLQKIVVNKDETIEVPTTAPDFRKGIWQFPSLVGEVCIDIHIAPRKTGAKN